MMPTDVAERWLEELEGNMLTVCKIPSRNGGYIRVPCSQNAYWFRLFCKRHTKRHSRRFPRHRTYIKRMHTAAALRRIIAGKLSGVYAERLIEHYEYYGRDI
jgi:hypothetical protein